MQNSVETKRQKQDEDLQQLPPAVNVAFGAEELKLNVGGSYFSTTKETLTSEQDTVFYVILSNDEEVKRRTTDGAVFIDRDPKIFDLILDYLRTHTIDVDNLSLAKRFKLEREAAFYHISSLIRLLHPPQFSLIRNQVKLSVHDAIATNAQIGDYSLVLSRDSFSSTCTKMKVKILQGKHMHIGVAFRDDIQTYSNSFNCGFYVDCEHGSLHGRSQNNATAKYQPIRPDSTVTIKLDKEFNVSFVVDGEDWGIAFRNVANDYSKPLHLAVIFWYANASILCPGQVQLLE